MRNRSSEGSTGILFKSYKSCLKECINCGGGHKGRPAQLLHSLRDTTPSSISAVSSQARRALVSAGSGWVGGYLRRDPMVVAVVERRENPESFFAGPLRVQ